MIVNENLRVEDMPVTGMGIQDEVSIFTLRKVPSDGKAVAECFRILGELEINVDMISQQMAQDGTCTVSFSCDDKQGEVLMTELGNHKAFDSIVVDREKGLAAVSYTHLTADMLRFCLTFAKTKYGGSASAHKCGP